MGIYQGPLQPKKPDWSEPLKIATAWYTVFAKQDWIEGVNYTFWTGSVQGVWKKFSRYSVYRN